MAKKRRILYFILMLVLLLSFNSEPLAGLAQNGQWASGLLPLPDGMDADEPNTPALAGSYDFVAENENFQLWVNKTTLGFNVVDKRSGYTWHSTVDQFEVDDRLNKTWRAFASSGISIEYLDQKAVSNRISIINSNTTLDVQPIDQGFQASAAFIDFGITIVVNVRLEANGVSVEVPSATIKQESVDYKLGRLVIYPFFGATRADTMPGYLFIPDGSGSLIRFSSVTKAKNMFFDRYYGIDLGMITSLPFDWNTNRPNNISIPVFGMVHGEKQNAFLSIVEKGAAYGEIQAHPAGIITNFNFLYHSFVYNESYFQPTSRSGDGVTTIQRKTNAFDVKIHYLFLTKDQGDYVGMARSYQQYLVDLGMLKKISDPGPDIGIRLEFLGGEKEKILFWYRPIAMTTVSQMADILNGLDLKNQQVIYYGWQPYGASSMPPKSMQLEGSLGDLNQLGSIIQKINAANGNFYLYLNPQAALRDESGYSSRNDLAMSISNSNLRGYNRQKVNYFFNLDTLSDRYSSLSRDVFSHQAGLALDGIGSILYSDFKNFHFLSRNDAILAYQKLLAQGNGSTSFYKPNDYMFSYMKAYFDMPISDNGYIYTTDVVPFLQIVLAGYVPFYGPALNFSSNTREDLLRQVDFDIYPSYFLSYDLTAKILNTSSNWIYSSSYQQWANEIKRDYQWLNNLLGPVKGQAIVARQVLKEGVFATTYSNGKQIIVNYTEQPYSSNGVNVNSRDAVIREVPR